jgi:hypothetical protein
MNNAKRTRQFTIKACACGANFTPTGSNNPRCAECAKTRAQERARETECVFRTDPITRFG